MADAPRTEGERWAHDELARLLAARFAPAATGRFLMASFRRADQRRRARLEVARRAWTWTAVGTGAWAALAVAGVQPFRRGWRHGMAWCAACGWMLDWHVGMVETEDGHPRQLGPADAVTLGRAWLVPVALHSPTPAVCAAAAVSDVVDGMLARRAEPTRLGRDLEGLVDAAFAAAALRGALREGLVGRAAVGCELARLGAGLGYALYEYFGRAERPDPGFIRAARGTTVVRAGGLVAAGAGRRRLADALVGGGSLASIAITARAVLPPTAARTSLPPAARGRPRGCGRRP